MSYNPYNPNGDTSRRLATPRSIIDPLDVIERQINGAAAAIARLEARRQTLLAFGEDDYEEGAALRFDRMVNGVKYSYLAIKSGGYWHCTGRTESGRARTWSELVEFITNGGIPEVWMVSEYVKVGAA